MKRVKRKIKREIKKEIEKEMKGKRGKKNSCGCGCKGCGGALYFMGIIGSAVYYISNSATFWEGVVGVLKALVWPAFLVHGLLTSLGI